MCGGYEMFPHFGLQKMYHFALTARLRSLLLICGRLVRVLDRTQIFLTLSGLEEASFLALSSLWLRSLGAPASRSGILQVRHPLGPECRPPGDLVAMLSPPPLFLSLYGIFWQILTQLFTFLHRFQPQDINPPVVTFTGYGKGYPRELLDISQLHLTSNTVQKLK